MSRLGHAGWEKMEVALELTFNGAVSRRRSLLNVLGSSGGDTILCFLAHRVMILENGHMLDRFRSAVPI